MFDAGSRTLLRQFKGHRAPVHVARFAADQLHVVTGGDDGVVALWDITSGQQVRSWCQGYCCATAHAAGVASVPCLLLPLSCSRMRS